MRVHGKGKICIDVSVELDQVVVDVRLRDGRVFGANVGDDFAKGDCIKALGGVV